MFLQIIRGNSLREKDAIKSNDTPRGEEEDTGYHLKYITQLHEV
jgi:hypothetical protein